MAFLSLDHYGPITRCVKDAALMLNAMKRQHLGDLNSLPDDSIDYLEALKEEPNSLRIGFSKDLGYWKFVDDEVVDIFLNSVKKFETLG